MDKRYDKAWSRALGLDYIGLRPKLLDDACPWSRPLDSHHAHFWAAIAVALRAAPMRRNNRDTVRCRAVRHAREHARRMCGRLDTAVMELLKERNEQ